MIAPVEFQAMARAIQADLSIDAAERLLAYLTAMLVENQSINLTAVRDPEAAVVFHALDSVAIASGGLDRAPTMALDLGTGNGFPGVAIGCLFPRAHVVLMDRTLKKLKAIERALAVAGLDSGQFEILQMDAAEAAGRGYKSKFDLVACRAVGAPAEIGRLAKPLLVRGGRLWLWLSDETEIPPALKGGLRRRSQVEYLLPPPTARLRRLVSYER